MRKIFMLQQNYNGINYITTNNSLSNRFDFLRKQRYVQIYKNFNKTTCNLRQIQRNMSNETINCENKYVKNSKYFTANCNGSTPMAKIIDGKQIAADFRAELRENVKAWTAQGNRPPKLTAILIGSDPASCRYVHNKMIAAKEVGIESSTMKLSTDVTERELLDIIEDLNNDNTVDGILVQLPVPEHMSERKICNAVSSAKDVDGFSERNVGRLCLDMNTLIPCTPLGVKKLLERMEIKTHGKKAVVVGRSKNVGMPIAMLLHTDGKNDTKGMDSTVTICHRYTPREDLITYCKLADIIITATGMPGLITADMVKPGACVIDVGITQVYDEKLGRNKLVGDVDFDAVKNIAGYITPVPGGVGPMTVAMLMHNTFIAAKNLKDHNK